MNRAVENLRRWGGILSARVPNYGVRRITQLLAVVRWELRLLSNNKTESLEFATGLFAIAFGVQIFRAPGLFNPAYYGHLVSLAPREIWGVVMVFAGADQIVALLTGTKWFRRVLAACMTAMWAFISAICWMTAPNNIASGMYTVVAFLCCWMFIRLGKGRTP